VPASQPAGEREEEKRRLIEFCEPLLPSFLSSPLSSSHLDDDLLHIPPENAFLPSRRWFKSTSARSSFAWVASSAVDPADQVRACVRACVSAQGKCQNAAGRPPVADGWEGGGEDEGWLRGAEENERVGRFLHSSGGGGGGLALSSRVSLG